MATDPTSFSNIAEVISKHIHLDVRANFETKTLTGFVEILFDVIADDCNKIVLDTRDLNVTNASIVPIENEECDISVTGRNTNSNEALGSSQEILLNKALTKGTQIKLKVEYETSPGSSGIQWLEKEQTEGKEHPYVFTQFQAIHCRSGLPCQDTPYIKQTYSANFTVQKPLRVLMSALSTGSKENEDNTVTYIFEQCVPIPSYLIAFVIGNLEGREVGPRTTVWAEPEIVEKAAWEFSNTEEYITTAEELMIPYEWGRYDLLCLPGSFPYGGMENPCLTFVTPTLLAGDRSLTSVVAHEIAHSWCGNLVTNGSWEDFWLNEGFTVFLERKIIGRLFGEKARQFAYINGWKALKDSVDLFGLDHEFTCLKPKLDGIDPDDAFSSVPYERGSQFLYYLESKVGGGEIFEPFFSSWIKKNKYKTVTTEQFQEYFNSYFADKVSEEVLSSINWQDWIYKVGMPPVDLLGVFDDTLAKEAFNLANSWMEDAAINDRSSDDIKDFNTAQIVAFLQKFILNAPLSHEALSNIDTVYDFSSSKNSEIRMRWYTLCLKSGYESIFNKVDEFLGEQGRMKFVRPLFRELYKCSPNGVLRAADSWAKYKNSYHNIAKKMIQKDLDTLKQQSNNNNQN
eukprot:TRINITY_DN67_c6_g1_i1.p1 TRINITY_DN67_c6_g1~~TRINITY_DN67_c6_g1_i1.p1  ORF type:complete len:627 (-),score=250.34 TRINITY_DN67_c6_g1_i1:151-2031(-)